MFILHWFVQELYLTWVQLRTDVTIPHVFTGIVLYSLVHFAAKTGQQSAQRVLHKEIQRLNHKQPNLLHVGCGTVSYSANELAGVAVVDTAAGVGVVDTGEPDSASSTTA